MTWSDLLLKPALWVSLSSFSLGTILVILECRLERNFRRYMALGSRYVNEGVSSYRIGRWVQLEVTYRNSVLWFCASVIAGLLFDQIVQPLLQPVLPAWLYRAMFWWTIAELSWWQIGAGSASLVVCGFLVEMNRWMPAVAVSRPLIRDWMMERVRRVRRGEEEEEDVQRVEALLHRHREVWAAYGDVTKERDVLSRLMEWHSADALDVAVGFGIGLLLQPGNELRAICLLWPATFTVVAVRLEALRVLETICTHMTAMFASLEAGLQREPSAPSA